MIWILLISSQGGYRYHSAHGTEAKAREWYACKEHDGDDVKLVMLQKDDADDLLSQLCDLLQIKEKP